MPPATSAPSTQEDWLTLLSEAWQQRETVRASCLEMVQAAEQWRLTQSESSVPTELHHACQVLRAFIDWREGRAIEALTGLEVVLAQAPEGSLWFVRALNVRCGVGFEMGDVSHGLTMLQEQLHYARELGDWSLEACALHDLGVEHNTRGMPHGEVFLNEALEKFQAIEDRAGCAFTYLNLAYAYMLKGQPDLAREHLRLADRVAEDNGLNYILTMSLAFQGSLELEHDAAQAEALLRLALHRQQQFGDRPMWEAAEPLTRLLMTQGRFGEAERLASDFLAEAEACQMRTMTLPMLALRSEIHEQMGDHARALADLKAHLAEFKSLRQVEYEQRINALEVQHRTQLLRSHAEIERQRAEEMVRLSLTDELTQLPNRRHLLQYGQELFSARQGAVCLLDIDHFKRINDEQGHDVGDQVLHEFAARLCESVRPGDFVARFGGEEFVVLLADLDTTLAARVLRRFQEELHQHPLLLKSGTLLAVTFTAGLATCQSGDLMQAIRQADELLYEGKRAGRNRVMAQ